MKPVRDLLAAAAIQLDGDGARLDAELLLAHACGQSRAWLYAHAGDGIEDGARIHFEHLVQRRAGGEPIAYLIGHREFWSLDLAVTPAVLIPRPETELLVELALARIATDRDCAVADLGTGSGAIALALARERPCARIVATDASAAALDVARANAEHLDTTNITYIQGDWCTALGGGHFDLIVSNPPYIAAADPHLQQGDLRHEPVSALASGVDGLDAIRRICADARDHLLAQGWLLLEHGWDQAQRVRELMLRHGFRNVHSVRDCNDHERVTLAIR